MKPCTPWRRRPERSDDRERKQRDRQNDIRRFKDCRKAFASKKGAIVTIAATVKIAVSDVDQGSARATRMKQISVALTQAAGSRHSRHNSAPADSRATVFTIYLPAHQ